MKTRLTELRIRAGGLLLTCLLCFATVITSQAQDLIVHLGYTPPLDQEQQHYLRTITDNPINEQIKFVEINMDALEEERLNFNPFPNEKYEVQKVDRGQNSHSLTSWCGQIIGYEYGGGDVNMVKAGEELVGHFTVDDRIYAITHIGNGLHVLYEVNSANAPAEDCYSHNLSTNGVKEKRPVITDPDYVNNLSEEKSSGDCKIRVLVGFTPAAEAQFTNILAQINNLINLANSAYNYGDVNFNIELAYAYRVSYTADSNNAVDLSRWRATNDEFMDEVHGIRSIWRADQCALIVPGGGGIAYLSLGYQDQFSVTGTSNFNVFTFHHELGHNLLCTHDLVNTDQPGSAPYAGWGDPSGCFRTVMAYPEACGTGACSRVNVFSRSIGTFLCGGLNRAIGSNNNRNVDRLVLSRNTVINHEVSTNVNVINGNYLFSANEAVHHAANQSVTYIGLQGNLFQLLAGSEGSFRAPDYVSLGEGFRASEGSFFEAFIDNCDNPFGDAFDESGKSDLSDNDLTQGKQVVSNDVQVYPNPFNQTVFVEFETKEYERVRIDVYGMMGQKVLQALDNPNLAPGKHRIEINTTDLPSGVYSITLDGDGYLIVKKVVKNR